VFETEAIEIIRMSLQLLGSSKGARVIVFSNITGIF
jgi:hypothetical protein